MQFGELLQNKRKRLRISAQELADRSGVSRSYITLIENNQRLPSRNVIPKIANALDIKVNIVVNWYLEDLRTKMRKDFDL